MGPSRRPSRFRRTPPSWSPTVASTSSQPAASRSPTDGASPSSAPQRPRERWSSEDGSPHCVVASDLSLRPLPNLALTAAMRRCAGACGRVRRSPRIGLIRRDDGLETPESAVPPARIELAHTVEEEVRRSGKSAAVGSGEPQTRGVVALSSASPQIFGRYDTACCQRRRARIGWERWWTRHQGPKLAHAAIGSHGEAASLRPHASCWTVGRPASAGDDIAVQQVHHLARDRGDPSALAGHGSSRASPCPPVRSG
jgi:hypothetical protein